jgi:DNA-binding MarR family transcriptional regulator
MKNKNDYGSYNNLNLKTLIALSRSNNIINKKSNSLFKAHDLTMMQFAVLEVLYHKGDLSIGEIIEKILATGGNMTVVIQNLLKEGLIEKYSSPKDQRISIIHITESGKAKIEEIFPQHLQQIDTALSNLTEDEKRQLVTLLKKISE